MSTFTRWVLAHKLIVIPFWLILTVVGLTSAQRANNALSKQFTVPGGEGITTSAAIVHRFGSGGTSVPILPVLTLPAGASVDSPGVRSQLAAAFHRIAVVLPGARIASYATTGDRAFVSHDGRTTFGLVYAPAHMTTYSATAAISRVRAALHGVTVDSSHFQVTGLDALSSGTGNNKGNGVMAETM